MTQLWEVASLVRSKNAGPFEITIDIICDSLEKLERIKGSRLADPSLYSALYHVPLSQVRVFVDENARAIKASFPRTASSGSINDTDIDGGQLHSLLVDMTIQ